MKMKVASRGCGAFLARAWSRGTAIPDIYPATRTLPPAPPARDLWVRSRSARVSGMPLIGTNLAAGTRWPVSQASGGFGGPEGRCNTAMPPTAFRSIPEYPRQDCIRCVELAAGYAGAGTTAVSPASGNPGIPARSRSRRASTHGLQNGHEPWQRGGLHDPDVPSKKPDPSYSRHSRMSWCGAFASRGDRPRSARRRTAGARQTSQQAWGQKGAGRVSG